MSLPTWSDLNNPGFVPPLGTRRAPEVDRVALMVSPGPDFKFLASIMGSGEVSPFFAGKIFIPQGESRGRVPVLAGPYLGAPWGAMVLESLIARGADTIIVFGWCGAVHPGLSTGDILIPRMGLVDEGTSINYMEFKDDPPQSFPSRKLTRDLEDFFKDRDLPFKTGLVWSTDAIYRETLKKIAFFRDKGALAVEMECSALFSVAGFRNCRVAAVLVVSDDLTGTTWKPGFKDPRFRESRKKAGFALHEFGCMLSVKQKTTGTG